MDLRYSYMYYTPFGPEDSRITTRSARAEYEIHGNGLDYTGSGWTDARRGDEENG
jgi:hypothetical protein